MMNTKPILPPSMSSTEMQNTTKVWSKSWIPYTRPLPLSFEVPLMKTYKIHTRKVPVQAGFIYTILENERFIIAGGAARSVISKEKIEDIDMFLYDNSNKDEIIKKLVDVGFKVVFECSELVTLNGFGTKVQVIDKARYGSTEELLDTFDFTICQVAIIKQYQDFVVAVMDNTIRDIVYNNLRINRIEYPVATLNRINKYINKGYRPVEDMYLYLFKKINNVVFYENRLSLYID